MHGVHYKWRYQYHGRWYDYDGISLEEIIDVSAPSPVGLYYSTTNRLG
jgi:hypothetical protein